MSDQEILARCEGLFHHIARRYYAPALTHDDLVQEARIGALRGLESYQEGRHWGGVDSFLAMCAERQVIVAVNGARRGKHSPLNEADRLDRMTGEHQEMPLAETIPDPANPDPLELVIAAETRQVIERTIADKLTAVERTAVCGVRDGASYGQMAGRIGVSAKRVDNAVQRGRRKIAAALAQAA